MLSAKDVTSAYRPSSTITSYGEIRWKAAPIATGLFIGRKKRILKNRCELINPN
jgi:hypothetical protein